MSAAGLLSSPPPAAAQISLSGSFLLTFLLFILFGGYADGCPNHSDLKGLAGCSGATQAMGKAAQGGEDAWESKPLPKEVALGLVQPAELWVL